MEVLNRSKLLSNQLRLLNLLSLGYLRRRRACLMRASAGTAATDCLVIREWPSPGGHPSAAASDMQAGTTRSNVRTQAAARRRQTDPRGQANREEAAHVRTRKQRRRCQRRRTSRTPGQHPADRAHSRRRSPRSTNRISGPWQQSLCCPRR